MTIEQFFNDAVAGKAVTLPGKGKITYADILGASEDDLKDWYSTAFQKGQGTPTLGSNNHNPYKSFIEAVEFVFEAKKAYRINKETEANTIRAKKELAAKLKADIEAERYGAMTLAEKEALLQSTLEGL